MNDNFLGEAVRCYQCASSQDAKGVDTCGAYKKFDKTQHIAVECNSEESFMPGSFCMKVTQQGPKGFICKFCQRFSKKNGRDFGCLMTYLT